MKNYPLITAVAGVICIAIGVCLPWYLGDANRVNGLDPVTGRAGITILVFALLRFGAIYLPRKFSRAPQIIATAILLLLILTPIKTAFRLESAQPGIGLLFLALGLLAFLLPARRWLK